MSDKHYECPKEEVLTLKINHLEEEVLEFRDDIKIIREEIKDNHRMALQDREEDRKQMHMMIQSIERNFHTLEKSHAVLAEILKQQQKKDDDLDEKVQNTNNKLEEISDNIFNLRLDLTGKNSDIIQNDERTWGDTIFENFRWILIALILVLATGLMVFGGFSLDHMLKLFGVEG